MRKKTLIKFLKKGKYKSLEKKLRFFDSGNHNLNYGFPNQKNLMYFWQTICNHKDTVKHNIYTAENCNLNLLFVIIAYCGIFAVGLDVNYDICNTP